jgi:hypothetical protein
MIYFKGFENFQAIFVDENVAISGGSVNEIFLVVSKFNV